MIVLALALQAAPIAPGELREMGDWLAWCPSGEPCRAELSPRGGPPRLALALMRGTAPARGGRAAPAVALVVTPPTSVPAGTRTRLSVDGTVFGDLEAPGGGRGLALPIDAVLRRGRTLTMAMPGGKTIASASLAGLSDALAFVTDHAATPPGERLTTPVVPDKPPRTLSTKQAAKLIPSQPCSALPPGVGRAVRLDARNSLALVASACGDDYILQPLIVDDKGDTRLAEVDDAPAIQRADWDAPANRLVLVEQRVSGARCTAERRYAWTGERFRLAERRWQCEGRPAPIVTYRARVTVG